MKQRKILLFYVLSLDHHMKILHLKLLIVNGNIRINMDFDVNFKIISFNYGFILNDFVIVDNGDENYFILLIHYKNLYILYFHICYLIECIFWTFFDILNSYIFHPNLINIVTRFCEFFCYDIHALTTTFYPFNDNACRLLNINKARCKQVVWLIHHHYIGS